MMYEAIVHYAYTCLYKPFDMDKEIVLIAEERRDYNFKGGESTC
jgi:hypothetical protein